jgi:hypothetical protein
MMGTDAIRVGLLYKTCGPQLLDLLAVSE